MGKPEFIKGAWIKEGAIVVDAGYHPSKVGDVELSTAIDKCFAYTPVPGGVGPMTIATLIAQTVDPQKKTLNIIFQPTRLASQVVEHDHYAP